MGCYLSSALKISTGPSLTALLDANTTLVGYQNDVVGATAPAHNNTAQKQARLAFVVDTSLELPTDKDPWRDILAKGALRRSSPETS